MTDGEPVGRTGRAWVVVLVVGALVAALVTAIVVSSGDDGDPATTTALAAAGTQVPATTAPSTATAGGDATGTTIPAEPPGETGPVEIVGAPLPEFAGNDPAADPAVGQPAPTLTGSGFDGEPVAADTGSGTAKAIVFLAHWCPHCQAEVPRVQEWLDGGGGVPGVEIVSVSTAVRPEEDNFPPSAWLAGEGWTSPVLRDSEDSEALIAYGAGGFPYWVFVDAQGAVVRRNAGELDIATLESYMREAAAGAAPLAGPPLDYAGFRAQPTACGAEQPPEATPMSFDTAQDAGIDPASTPLATITTSCGAIVVELDPAVAPATVNSFVFLADQGYFDGTVAHRVLPGFVVQAGDPSATGMGSPGYAIPDELPPAGTLYTTGTLAMANAGPGTAGSQFFVMLGDVGLPPDYAIFGRVVEGQDALDAIAAVPLGPNAQGEPSVPLETVYIEAIAVER